MPRITVSGQSAEWPTEKRLVNAIEDMGVHIGHRCGGNARCTTCRVTFTSGEPDTMTIAEFHKLRERGLYGQYRLACQILCRHDMQAEPAMTLENQEGWTDTGPRPDDAVQPAAEWFPRAELEQQAE
jgi:ferredoxin